MSGYIRLRIKSEVNEGAIKYSKEKGRDVVETELNMNMNVLFLELQGHFLIFILLSYN